MACAGPRTGLPWHGRADQRLPGINGVIICGAVDLAFRLVSRVIIIDSECFSQKCLLKWHNAVPGRSEPGLMAVLQDADGASA